MAIYVGTNTYIGAITGGSDTTTLNVYQGNGPVNLTGIGGTVEEAAPLPIPPPQSAPSAVNGTALTCMRSDAAPALPATLPALSGVNLTSLNATNLASGTVPAARGGAGTINGALKANGSGVVSQAACADLSNAGSGCSGNAATTPNVAAASNT